MGILIDGHHKSRDETVWPKRLRRASDDREQLCHVNLDGFRYERFAEQAPTSAAVRKSWLKLQPPDDLGGYFRPQPFEQLARVLKDMGHDEEAKKIAIQKQGALCRAAMRQAGLLGRMYLLFKWLLYGFLTGWGYRPQRLFFVIVGLGLVCGFLYQEAARQGIFEPSDAQSSKYDKCRPPEGQWVSCHVPGLPVFNGWLYSIDALVPGLDLKLAKAWEPRSQSFNLSLANVPGVMPLFNSFKVAVPEWAKSVPYPHSYVPLPWWVTAEKILGPAALFLLTLIVTGLLKRD